MKIYTSEVSQHGRELLILNEVVQFDKTGSVEVEDEFGEKLLRYSPWFTTERATLKVEKPKEYKIEDELKSQEILVLRAEIGKIEKKYEARAEKTKFLELEIEELKGTMAEVVTERDNLLIEKGNVKVVGEGEVELLNYKFELALLNINELRATCKELGVKEEKYVKEKDKKQLIETIISVAK